MKKRLIMSIIIIVIIFVVVLIYWITQKDKKVENANRSNINTSLNSTKQESRVYEYDIKERKYNKINNNLYYDDELIEAKGQEDKETILNYYRVISNYLENNFPNIEVYIYNLNYDSLTNSIWFKGYQIINMVIVEGSHFTMAIKNNDIISEEISNYINIPIDTTNVISINEVKQKAIDLSKGKDIGPKDSIIPGEWYFVYDGNNLCYKVIINYWSYVKINAVTGETLGTYFFNGIYY